ncbi:MAG: site-specific DNA-methyltransferase [Anaerococcus vaginalis]|nr:site-specific DNA-methyltransferase [Anaerococcus vaginalis]
MKALIGNKLLKDVFFTKVDDIYVFDKNKFVWVLESKEFLPDSFTMYKNKICLVDSNNNLISQKQDVSLVWPYKDCILEGGQSKEDQKRDEIFYNETLAPDQVNKLLAPKVLGNAKRYTNEGIEENIELKEDDNLIIKGNNLLALSSLLGKYEGRAQFIYIDPPFNTGGDSFMYNDRFNHSSWISFMKNRLVIAKRLLSESANSAIHLDWNEAHYLKILCDEIFGRDNFLNEIIWHYEKWTASSKNLQKNHDSILVYSKNKGLHKFNIIKQLTDSLKEKYEKGYLIGGGGGGSTGLVVYDDTKPGVKEMINSGKYEVVYSKPEGKTLSDVWYIPFINPVSHERTGFNSQKPEKLISRLISIFTDEHDIVLDYHLGSGTTAAGAHKMNRKYIGVEQMDRQVEIILNRLSKVIEGDQLGISKDVNWQGGSSFVYCELLEDNESLVNELEKAENTEQVKIVLNKAIDNGKLIPSVLPSDLKENEEDFDKLSLDEQKNLVMELLNENQLYVNLSDIDDEDYRVSEADKEFTRSFLQKI